MRCTRCDGIAVPQRLGRLPTGELVFGWCESCLKEQHCTIVEETPARLRTKEPRPIRRSWRKLRVAVRRLFSESPAPVASRRLAGLGLAGLMAAWALILAFIGGLKLIGDDDKKGPFLLAGSGLMALVSLAVWAAILGRQGGFTMIRRVLRVAGGVAGFGMLAWGLARPEPRRASVAVAASAVAFAVAWAARPAARDVPSRV